MRIAFLQQPIGHLLLPRGDRPLRSNSTGIWTYEMAVRCAARHEVSVFGLSPERREIIEDHRGVRFHSIAAGFDHWRLNLSTKIRRTEARLGLQRNPGKPYFLSRLFFAQYAAHAALAVRRQRIEVLHLANFPQFAPIFRRLNPQARILLHMHCDWLRQLDAAALERSLAACDSISGCSRYIAGAIQERFPGHASKAFHMYNGVDADFFRPAAARPDAPPELLYVGRLSPEKGIHVLIGAYVRVARQIPGLRLTLVGTQRSVPAEYIVAVDPDPLIRHLSRFYSADPDAYRKHLESQIPPELARQVTFSPSCPQRELLPFYQRATLFVAPSICREAFGMPLAEAMACELPVVATRTGGIPEVVAEGATGLLVEREEEEALAEAIRSLLSDAPRRKAMGEGGRRRVLEQFVWDQVAAKFMTFLKEPVCNETGYLPSYGPAGG